MRDALADWAQRQHLDGVREDTSTNDGEPVRRYALPKEPPAPWCARMVRTGLMHIGALTTEIATAHDLYEMGSARFLYGWLVEHGAMKVHAAVVEPGDLRFLIGRGGSDPMSADGGIHHVGIVVGIDADEPISHVVDGNWSDRVSLNVEKDGDPRSLWLRWPVG